MSYSKNWGPMLFKPKDMTVSAIYPYRAPEADTQKHLDESGIPTCFLAWANPTISAVNGTWLTSDILISSLIGDPSASDLKLTGFTYTSHTLWVGSPSETASFLLDIDGARVIDRILERFSTPTERTVGFNQLLTGSYLKFGLYQQCGIAVYGWIEQHIYGYKVFGTYITTTPPQTRQVSVRVYDVVSAKPIVGATVTLLSGITVVASGKTDSQGLVTLNAFDQSYLVRVYAIDYTPYPFEATVDLTVGSVSVDAPLVYVAPILPYLPWWAIPVIVGVAGVGGVMTLGAIRGRREREPVYVIK